MEYIVVILESMSEAMIQKKSSKVILQNRDLPFDLKFFTNTVDLFYEINSQLPVANSAEIEFYMESGIWFIQEANYSGTNFVKFNNEEKIKEQAKDHRRLWGKVRKCLSEYFYYLLE